MQLDLKFKALINITLDYSEVFQCHVGLVISSLYASCVSHLCIVLGIYYIYPKSMNIDDKILIVIQSAFGTLNEILNVDFTSLYKNI